MIIQQICVAFLTGGALVQFSVVLIEPIHTASQRFSCTATRVGASNFMWLGVVSFQGDDFWEVLLTHAALDGESLVLGVVCRVCRARSCFRFTFICCRTWDVCDAELVYNRGSGCFMKSTHSFKTEEHQLLSVVLFSMYLFWNYYASETHLFKVWRNFLIRASRAESYLGPNTVGKIF